MNKEAVTECLGATALVGVYKKILSTLQLLRASNILAYFHFFLPLNIKFCPKFTKFSTP